MSQTVMTTEIIIKCEPVSEPSEVIVKSEPPSPGGELEDHATSDTRCQPQFFEARRIKCEPDTETSALMCVTVPASSKVIENTNPELIYVKPEPTVCFNMHLEEIETDDPHLTEIRKEQSNDDDDDDYSDTDSNEATDTELPSFDESNIITSSSGQYQCPTCKKWLSKKGNFQRHYAIHLKEKLTCKYCGQVLTTMHLLKQHIAVDHGKTFECATCHKMFRTNANLEQHIRSHIKPYQCDLCDKRFSTMGNLIKHRGKSRCKKPNSEPLYCEICDKTFKTQYLYKSHQVMHSTERPYQCDICQMTFKHTSALTRHTQLHNNDKPYSCDHCGKRFTSKGLLKPHMRSHTGERPYTCLVCQKSFAHKHNMLKHSLLHNVVKHLICEICHKEFPRESRLKYHMRKHMPDNRPFKCQHCPKCYSCKQNMIRHYKKKHPTKSYDIQETDASIATVMWETVIKKKLEVQTDYILPDEDVPIIGVDIDETSSRLVKQGEQFLATH